MHLDACRGRLTDEPIAMAAGAAAAILYAPRAITLPDGFEWPEWTADRTPSGALVASGAPLCTVIAEAADAVVARSLVAVRLAALHERVGRA
jgi:predicted ATP-grasp superfamily ATP-dependent carboligase